MSLIADSVPSYLRTSDHYRAPRRVSKGRVVAALAACAGLLGLGLVVSETTNIDHAYQAEAELAQPSGTIREQAHTAVLNSSLGPHPTAIDKLFNTYAAQQRVNNGEAYYRFIINPALVRIDHQDVVVGGNPGMVPNIEEWLPGEYVICGQNGVPPRESFGPLGYDYVHDTFGDHDAARLSSSTSLPGPCDFAVTTADLTYLKAA